MRRWFSPADLPKTAFPRPAVRMAQGIIQLRYRPASQDAGLSFWLEKTPSASRPSPSRPCAAWQRYGQEVCPSVFNRCQTADTAKDRSGFYGGVPSRMPSHLRMCSTPRIKTGVSIKYAIFGLRFAFLPAQPLPAGRARCFFSVNCKKIHKKHAPLLLLLQRCAFFTRFIEAFIFPADGAQRCSACRRAETAKRKRRYGWAAWRPLLSRVRGAWR